MGFTVSVNVGRVGFGEGHQNIKNCCQPFVLTKKAKHAMLFLTHRRNRGTATGYRCVGRSTALKCRISGAHWIPAASLCSNKRTSHSKEFHTV